MKPQWIDEAIKKTEDKIRKTASRAGDALIYYTTSEGKYVPHDSGNASWWTNGFWPGILWLLYRDSKDESIRAIAESAGKKLDEVLYGYDQVDHDAGFMWKLSAVTEYQLTGNETARKKGLLAAALLASRYTGNGEYIRAWNHEGREGIAIIDCMMNLPILYWASEEIKDNRYTWFAKKHADTVIDKFMHPDGSVRHQVRFSSETGEVIEYPLGQGYSPDSAWSRGNAWALYGFALSYKLTGERRYYDAAKRVANFFIAALPEDYVPFADFKAPAEENINKDSSAASCAASGLLLLASCADEFEKDIYQTAGEKIVYSLYTNYTDWSGEQEALLLKANVSYHYKPISGDYKTLIYADYFFYEALKRLEGKEGLFELMGRI